MLLYKQIWNLANFRFLQGEASSWVISNKILEAIFFIGILVWIYFEFFVESNFTYLKYIGLIILFFSIGEIRSRMSLYKGYFDGYEKGFEDAATRNCDYCGKTRDKLSDEIALKSVLDDIKVNEENIDERNITMRDSEAKKGYSQLMGLFTWRKIRKI